MKAAIEHAAIVIDQFAIAMPHVVHKLALVLVAVRPHKSSLPLTNPVDELAGVVALVWVDLLAKTMP